MKPIAVAVAVLASITILLFRGSLSHDPSPPQERFGSAPTALSERVVGGRAAPLSGGSSRDHSIISSKERDLVAGRALVRFVHGASPVERRSLLARLGLRPVGRVGSTGAVLVAFGSDRSVREVRSELGSHPLVSYAEPDFVYRATAATPNDPLYPQLWALGTSAAGRINAPESWVTTTGDSSILVAVVDTGIAQHHPDLRPNRWINPGESGGGRESNGLDDDGNGYVDDWRGWDFVTRSNAPADLQGHGTHVAGTIGAVGADGSGVAGINWNVGLIGLRALDRSGSGRTSDIAAAFSYAGEMGAHVVNASLGGSGYSQTLYDSIRTHPDTLYVVAAGNNGSDNETTPSYPCNFDLPNLICVAATDRNDALAGFSNYGVSAVDLAAPGVSILSDRPTIQTLLQDRFESGSTGWRTTGTAPGWSLASDTTGGYITDGQDPYAPNVDSAIELVEPVDLTGSELCALTFAMRLDTEPKGDTFILESSPDGTSWRRLRSWSGSTGDSWIGASVEFHGGSRPLFRFRLVADGDAQVGRGVDLDDVSLGCAAETYGSDSYTYASGTSMAAPHVAGAAALIWSVLPDATVDSVRDLLLGSVKPVAALQGRIATGGRLDLRRALDNALGTTAAPSPSTSPVIDATTASPSSPPVSPSPTATPSSLPSPTPSPTSSQIPSPSPSPPSNATPPAAGPTPDLADEPTTVPPPTVALRLRRHLVVRGDISTAVDCGRLRVAIQRNGKTLRTIRTTATDAFASFRVRVADRRGTYQVRVRPTAACPGAVSAAWAHRHRPTRPDSFPINDMSATRTDCVTGPTATVNSLVAAERRDVGVLPLEIDESLAEKAMSHSQRMRREAIVSPVESEVLETVAPDVTAQTVGSGADVDAVLGALLASPAGRHVLDPTSTRIGIGLEQDRDVVWMTLLFTDEPIPEGSAAFGC